MTDAKMKSVGAALTLAALTLAAEPLAPFGPEPRVPAFSISYMDRSVDPAVNFYSFADGQWRKDNPVPADKARWAAFTQLAERNWFSIHEILDDAAGANAAPRSPRGQVGEFYTSAMNTNRIEQLGLNPVQADLKRIDRVKSIRSLFG